jgi:threonine/homoserine/homoserine lactone efflux protein
MGVAVTAYLVFAASQIGTPGPANMALMTAGARYGLRAALPFVAGVALGKQLVVWPLGLGLMSVSQSAPWVFEILKWVCVGYVLWLAWRIAGTSLVVPDAAAPMPGFLAGLWVQPLNPKAWAMVTAGFTSFTTPGTPALQATFVIAMSLLACQIVLHPLWTLAGDRIASLVAGTPAERFLMMILAGLTVASVVAVLFLGGKA